ncbi:ATP-dependent DNA helicase [Salaquimonas pukyongi]|uniref:ATP-dependent DNA helicase n=1 Tax=Salaquimonas pukyongi TaxID=2712698 RepID=UPI00096BB6C4|nr:ATP-dependent RecD-like DNA helicase [Salaquimonas pukyongi]
MEFSAEQDRALGAVHQWLKAGDRQVFRLFGYAGTGKTTLARHFAEGVDGDVLFAAFTGKAAQVLRSKGARKASTIHSVIYRPRGEEEVEDEETGSKSIAPTFSLNRRSPVSEAKLIIIDECSMVDEALGRDLLSFGTPVLVLGDPGQLPPVSGGGFFTDYEPDFLLEEIHRQARGNPIIDLAQQVREGRAIMYGDYGATARVISKSEVTTDQVLAADQVLVGTNRTRRRYNDRLRQLKGFDGPFPQAGDKLVCLRNDTAKGLLNGSLWTVTSAARTVKSFMNLLIRAEDDGIDRYSAKVKVLKSVFETPDADIPWQERRRYDDFDYGYALTVHKAQGSQWDEIILFDESGAFREHAQRWLYTGITRASERITIVR